MSLFGIGEGIASIGNNLTNLVYSAYSSNRDKKFAEKQATVAYERQLALQQNAYDLYQQSLKESSGNYVEGLKNAGLNPVLAAGNTGSGFSTSGSAPIGQAVQTKDWRSELLSNAYQLSQLRNLEEQNENIRQQTEKVKLEQDNLKDTRVLLKSQAVKTMADGDITANKAYAINDYFNSLSPEMRKYIGSSLLFNSSVNNAWLNLDQGVESYGNTLLNSAKSLWQSFRGKK